MKKLKNVGEKYPPPPPSVPVKEFVSSSFQHPLNKRHPLAMEKIPRERKIKCPKMGSAKYEIESHRYVEEGEEEKIKKKIKKRKRKKELSVP